MKYGMDLTGIWKSKFKNHWVDLFDNHERPKEVVVQLGRWSG